MKKLIILNIVLTFALIFAIFCLIPKLSEPRFEKLYHQSLERNNEIINYCNTYDKWTGHDELPNF